MFSANQIEIRESHIAEDLSKLPGVLAEETGTLATVFVADDGVTVKLLEGGGLSPDEIVTSVDQFRIEDGKIRASYKEGDEIFDMTLIPLQGANYNIV